jgi:hypothetical protein
MIPVIAAFFGKVLNDYYFYLEKNYLSVSLDSKQQFLDKTIDSYRTNY